MKAIFYEKYGQPDVLELREVDKPAVKDDEVLVRVHAASINSWDWDLLRGTPLIIRLWGLLKPRHKIPGADIAGRVEAVGRKVERFQPGDEVFGDLSGCGWGGFAEYACAREKDLTLKSADMTFEEAAAMPQAAVMALQGINEMGQVQPGQKVLIIGAGGGVGSFAVQIAKSLGAEVTGVDSGEKLDLVRSIGSDHVIDYTKEDFTEGGQRYDLVLDCATYRSIFANRRVLNPKGTYISVGGSLARVFQVMFLGPLVSLFGSKKMGVLGLKPNRNLATLNELFEAGKVAPLIEKRYPLSEVPEALRHFGEGHFRGKIVITI